jgi:predicted phage terminase large subunit-like protein
LAEDDPTGHWLAKEKENVKHICLPGEITTYRQYVKPIELILNYTDNLLDPVRMSQQVLEDMEFDLGQYGYAGQVGQNPVPPTGGMFQTDHFQIVDHAPSRVNYIRTIRYWDKAATEEKKKKSANGARTAGVKMTSLSNGKFLVEDAKGGRWGTDKREDIIRETAEADGPDVFVYTEQEPGSGGKDSALATIRNLAGFSAGSDRPRGDKVYRADPYSVQVNHGNILLLRGDWNAKFINDHMFFPFGKTKDFVDATSGAFSKLAGKKEAGSIRGERIAR